MSSSSSSISSSSSSVPSTATNKGPPKISVNMGLGGGTNPTTHSFLGKKRPRTNEDNHDALHKAGFDTGIDNSNHISSRLNNRNEDGGDGSAIISAAGIFTSTVKEPEKPKLIIPLDVSSVSSLVPHTPSVIPSSSENVISPPPPTTATTTTTTFSDNSSTRELQQQLFRNIKNRPSSSSSSSTTNPPADSQIARLKKLRETINRRNPNDIGNDLAVRPDEHEVTSSSYTAIPVTEFGAAVLRGMGVSEQELQLAMEPAVIETSNTSSTPRNGKKEKVAGLGAASNPLSLLNSSSSSLSSQSMGKSLPSTVHSSNTNTQPKPMSKANLLREQSAMYGRLHERQWGRIIAVPLSSPSSATSSSTTILPLNSLGMVWQLTGVPGLSKIRIRTYRAKDDANNTFDKLRTLSETTEEDTLNHLLRSIHELSPITIISIKDVEPINDTNNLIPQEQEYRMKLDYLIHMEQTIEKWKKLKKESKLELPLPIVQTEPSTGTPTMTTTKDEKIPITQPTVVFGASTVNITQTNTLTTRVSTPTNVSSSSSHSSLPSWLLPGIIVRIVDEHYLQGKYFRQKAIIQDVPLPYTANLLIINNDNTAANHNNSSSYIDNVPEKYLETALPKVGGKGMVVKGPYRNTVGEVMERNSQAQQITLRFYNDSRIKVLSYDDVAEYAGSIQ